MSSENNSESDPIQGTPATEETPEQIHTLHFSAEEMKDHLIKTLDETEILTDCQHVIQKLPILTVVRKGVEGVILTEEEIKNSFQLNVPEMVRLGLSAQDNQKKRSVTET